MAICELHGVSAKAGLVAQLKAVEKEYQQLKEAGQSHKSEHVQQLYAWKSKQALQVNPCHLQVDTHTYDVPFPAGQQVHLFRPR